jgi:hypothetical protein
MPMWPHPRIAEEFIGKSTDDKPCKISVNKLLKSWMPNLIEDKILISISPTLEMKGIVIQPEVLKKDLEQELKTRY